MTPRGLLTTIGATALGFGLIIGGAPALPDVFAQEATPPAADVPKIKAAILVHHGALDAGLVKAYPAYEAELKKNNIPFEGHIWPNSVHGFFNDATPERYNKATAAQAWNQPSIFSLMPPTGSTSPCWLSAPVTAMPWRSGRPDRLDSSA